MLNLDDFPAEIGFTLKLGDVKKVCEDFKISITSAKIIRKICDIISGNNILSMADIADVTALVLCEGKYSDWLAFNVFSMLVSVAQRRCIIDNKRISQVIKQTRIAYRDEVFGTCNCVPLGKVACQFGYKEN